MAAYWTGMLLQMCWACWQNCIYWHRTHVRLPHDLRLSARPAPVRHVRSAIFCSAVICRVRSWRPRHNNISLMAAGLGLQYHFVRNPTRSAESTNRTCPEKSRRRLTILILPSGLQVVRLMHGADSPQTGWFNWMVIHPKVSHHTAPCHARSHISRRVHQVRPGSILRSEVCWLGLKTNASWTRSCTHFLMCVALFPGRV